MFLFAKTIYEVMSPFSGRIRVIEQGHERRVIIGGYVQSRWNFAKGAKALHGTVWDGFLRFPFAIKPVPRTLILGLGGGTAVCLLQDKFGSTLPIVGVDIDPEMITIAHRLTTLKNSDRILVFDKGKIVQEGTFDELSGKKGLFQDFLRQRTQ